MGTQYTQLTEQDRWSIQTMLFSGHSQRSIASSLGVSPSTISREVRRARPAGTTWYLAVRGQSARMLARRSAGRMRRKLDPLWRSPCARHVVAHLRAGWSPEQIAGRLKAMHEAANDPSLLTPYVCHETIYCATYAQPRGTLRTELVKLLRKSHAGRLPRARGTARFTWLQGMTSIDLRPPEVAARIVPGHWEGDLIKGARNASAVGTIVERTSRYLMLVKLDDAGYYQRDVLLRADQQSEMEAKIRAVYDEHKGRYGYRRIAATLRSSLARPINHKGVQRLMQKMGLRSLVRPKKRNRYVLGASDVNVPNVLQRNFRAPAPNRKWVTDITEFNVNGHKLYLSACMDLYYGEIVAHRTARRPVFELVSGTLRVVLPRPEDSHGLVVHSDQGWQYKMQPYRDMLAGCGVTQSMSRKGNCYDNAAMESFFGTLKAEFFHLEHFNGISELEAGVNDYVRYYNHDRIKLGLEGISPAQYRLKNTA